MGDVDKSKLPGSEALQVPGKDQEVKMVRNGELVEAYQFQQSDGKWIKIGQVVDAVGASRKQVFEGQEYDYVFDIDISDDLVLKLPYNVTGIVCFYLYLS